MNKLFIAGLFLVGCYCAFEVGRTYGHDEEIAQMGGPNSCKFSVMADWWMGEGQ